MAGPRTGQHSGCFRRHRMIQFFGRTLALVALIFWAGMALAQDNARKTEDPLHPFWDEAADFAEATIDNANDSTTDDLELLRSRLVRFRNEFSEARSANADRIASLQSQ